MIFLDHIIAVDERHLKRLLSEYIRTRGPHASGTREGNARRQTSYYNLRSRPFSCATGRAAPPVRLGCLIRTNGVAKTYGFVASLIYTFFRERFLALE